MEKIRWGVLSTAKIGLDKVIPAMQSGGFCEIVAIASRDLDKARAMASKLGIPRAYGSYEELLADQQIDAVYNPLPNHLHVPWSIKCLQAGKHVLCEKPIGLNLQEVGELLLEANLHPRLRIMEAFMYRMHPQWQLARRLVREGQIGQLRTIQTCFSYYNANPANIRNIAEVGGGGMYDIGCYCISSARFIFGSEPKRAIGIVEFDPVLRTDRLASGVLEFSSGTSTFTCSTQLSPYQRVNIFGTEGRVEIEIPFNAPPDRPCKLWHQRGAEVQQHTLEVCDQYAIQGDLFSKAILDGEAAPTALDDAVANMRVIEAVLESANTGRWVDC
ncbi:MAG TPA: Gfo/Idh/MocA family oxidoreductase [Pirellulales bacterium]|jgi:predicted dehydrogenase